MTDNIVLNPGFGGDIIATDDINGEHHQQVKIEFGGENTASAVTAYSRLPVEVTFADSDVRDAFGSIRVSNPKGLGQYKHTRLIHSAWATATGPSGDASSSLDTNRASRLLYVGTTANDGIIHQTKKYFPYQPGKSQFIAITGRFGAVYNGVTQRIGYFDNDNGLFFQIDENGVGVTIRDSVSGSVHESTVYQSNWNVDAMDGTGPSGVTLDPTKAQIFIIDFQWLGTGRVRFGFFIDSQMYYVHHFFHANNISSAYMSTADLPLRAEVSNSVLIPSGSTTMELICAVAESERGSSNSGIQFSVGTPATDPVNMATGRRPLLSIRFKDGVKGIQITELNAEVLAPANSSNAFKWELIHNPTISDAASWQPVTSSYLEFDYSRSGSVTGGHVLAGGYGATAAGVTKTNLLEIETQMGFGVDINGNRDEFVLVVEKQQGQAVDFYGTLSWKEIY